MRFAFLYKVPCRVLKSAIFIKKKIETNLAASTSVVAVRASGLLCFTFVRARLL